jgi:hypothetical protein
VKYAQAMKGRRAERTLNCPIPGSETGLTCVAVAMAGDEEAECLAFALKYAKDKGVAAEHATMGNPLYDLAYAAKVVELTIRDPSSGEPGRRAPTFDGTCLKLDGQPYGSGVEEILGELQRETIMYLFRIAEHWADEVSPMRRNMSDLEMVAGVRELAKEGDESLRFFDGCGLSMRLRYMRFMASQCVSLLEPKSGPGTSTESSTSTPTSSSPTPRRKSRTRAGSS